MIIVCHQKGLRCRAQPRVFEQQSPTNGEGRGRDNTNDGCTGRPSAQMPPRLLPPSHWLEINYKVTARREPSYRILTVPSCPLLERRWSVLYLQTFLFLFSLPPGGKSAKQKPQQPKKQRNLNGGLQLYSCVQYTQLDSGKRIASTHSQKYLLFSRTTFTHTTNRACHYTEFGKHCMTHSCTHTQAERLNTTHLSSNCYVNNVKVFCFRLIVFIFSLFNMP